MSDPIPEPEVTQTTTQSVTHTGESSLAMGRSNLSARSIMAIVVTGTLCGLTVYQPDLFKEAFTVNAALVIGFYFGQSKTK